MAVFMASASGSSLTTTTKKGTALMPAASSSLYSSQAAAKPSLIHLANTVCRNIQSSFPKLKATFVQWRHPIDQTTTISCAPMPAVPNHETAVQELHVYEFNERDRGSPVFLKLTQSTEKSLGDFASFTNKIYSGDLKKRIGITAGSIMYIKQDEAGGDRYEATYSFYFGDNYGHISVQGPYFAKKDTYLAVTGGTGIFEGAYGKVRLHNILYPLKLHYTFYLQGIKDLPSELVGKPVEPHTDVQPSAAAVGLEPEATVAGFTD